MWRALKAAICEVLRAEMPAVPKATSCPVVSRAMDCSGDRTEIWAGVSAETWLFDKAAICAGIIAAT